MQTGRTRGRPNNNSTVLLLVPPCRTRSRDLINIPPWAPFTPVLIRSRNLWRTHIRDARPICAPSAAAAAVRARMLLPSRMYTCSFILDSFGCSGCTRPIRRFGFRLNDTLGKQIIRKTTTHVLQGSSIQVTRGSVIALGTNLLHSR